MKLSLERQCDVAKKKRTPVPGVISRLDKCCAKLLWLCPTFETLWTLACQTPLSMEFSSKNTGVGCHVLLQGIFLIQGLNLCLICPCCCCCSVTKLCLTHCDPVNCSVPGFPVLHYLPEFAQSHVHWVSDAIQTSYPLSSPSPLSFNLSQHQGLF